jgi:hypothetical protein
MTRVPLASLIPAESELQSLDLDQIREHLEAADTALTLLDTEHHLYELELQRELRAKVDLAGPVPACPDPEAAFKLSGQPLLEARRDACRQFNKVFFMAPLSRKR